MTAPELSLAGIEKRFGAVRALRGVNFEAVPGEVHALLGENGSGKTTLMRVLEGDVQPDAGTIRLGGSVASFPAPAHSRRAGIGVVHQEPHLAADLTVGENVLMGRLPRRRGAVHWRAVERTTRDGLDKLGIALDHRSRVGTLSPDRRQLVEIARVLTAEPMVIALDEPTAALTEDQVDVLFTLLRRLRARGCLVIYITHRLREIFALCDRVTVLRDGETRATVRVADADEDQLVRLMVGRELGKVERTPAEAASKPRLEVRGLSRGGVLHDIDLSVRAGEIVGIAGLVGAGRSALIRTLFGLRPAERGEIVVEGRRLRADSPKAALRRGMALVPEDRHRSALCLQLSVRENIALGDYGSRPLASGVRLREQRRRAQILMAKLDIRAAGPEAKTSTLSGGNQQKVVLARWLSDDLGVLVLDEPTRGIDVGAKAQIYRLLDDLARDGTALLVSSSDLPELLTLCDRIYAMYRGRLVEHFTRQEATEEGLARAIAGAAA
jgi:ABC-type sugar transport system ATPase subunit